jgi:hypothetical protein
MGLILFHFEAGSYIRKSRPCRHSMAKFWLKRASRFQASSGLFQYELFRVYCPALGVFVLKAEMKAQMDMRNIQLGILRASQRKLEMQKAFQAISMIRVSKARFKSFA